MSKPSIIMENRISRDSGICVEDSDRSSSSLGKNESAVKKRFPAGGGKAGRGRMQSSYVRRLTQHFETLTCHDESDRSSPTTLSTSSCTFYQLDLGNSSTEQMPQAEVEHQVPASADESDKSEVKMDDAVQVIENIYEQILVEEKRESNFSVSQRIHLTSVCDINPSGDHPVDDSKSEENICANDKITKEGELDDEVSRDFGLVEHATESVTVAEARNTFISQEPAQHSHYYDDDEFSDTDSFESSDDDVEPALNDSRPDSNSSLKSERITNIMKELLENEENYVLTLEKGIENYISIMVHKDVPPALRGQRYHIFGNIESIYEFHRDRFLPKLRDNCASIQGIAETFIKLIEDDRFYCYILFALNRPKSEKICNKNLDFFQERQNQVGDKLGLNSFLLQPIQRLPRYKLLLSEINKEVLKLIADALMDSVKDEIGILCKAEKRLERFIDVVNEAMSINDICECYEDFKCMQTDLMNSFSVAINLLGQSVDTPPVLILRASNNKNPDKNKALNIFHQGKFRKMFEMDFYDWDRRRRYPGKIFFFEKCIIYTEKIKEYLEYRGHFVDSEVGLYNDGKSKLCVFAKKRGIQEVEISNTDIGTVQKMASYIEAVMKGFAMQERERINDLTRKKDWCEQRVPSVMTINRGSVASTKSNLSIISNNSNRESYDSGSQTTWDSEKPVQSLVSAQKHFCQILATNRKYYFSELPDELSEKINRFIHSFDRLVEIHTKRVYEDFAQQDVGVDEVCELFILYYKEDLFEPYNTYLKQFKKAAGIMKNIHRASRTSLSGTMVAQTTDDFTFMLIEIWNKYQNFVQTQIVRMSEQMNDDVNGADKDLFRKLAFVEVQINTFRKSLMQNYKLFNLDDNVAASSLGLVVYSERVRYGNETLSSHRILICEKATVCVRVQMVKDIDRHTEKYIRIVFIDKFVRGVPVVKLSKKSDIRLNFEISSIKHPVDFGNKANKDKFFGNYCMFYEKCFRSRW